ncbi:reverse transcriptase domain-containing protein [Tanacetum coccineum]
MENASPPPTSNRLVLPAALRAQAIQEIHELQRISAFVDSRLESIERFLNNFANQPNETNMSDLESDDESVDTPLVSPFPHSDNDSDDGEVLNELIEYGNVGMLRREKEINSFDGDDLTFQSYNTTMVEGLESAGKNLVVVVRDVYVFVGCFIYITDFVVLEDIGEFIQINKAEVIESHKSSTEHPIVNEFISINIPEEDVEPEPNLPLQEIIILDPDDQPMWENAKIVAPTPNSATVQPNVDDNFVINSTHLKMIHENKFDGHLRADPHDHIREFLAICNMFRYGETQSEAVKLLIFPLSLCDEAETWFHELNEESITSWEQMRRDFINKFFPPSLFKRLLLEIRNFSQLVCESLTDAWLRLKSMLRKCHRHCLTKGAIIHIFCHGLDEPTQAILDVTARGIFLYKSPNQAFQFLEDKVLFNLDWSIKSKNEHHQKSVSFTDGTNYIQSEDYQNQDSHNSFSHQSHHDPNDSEKSLKELNNDVRNDLEDFKRYIHSMRNVHWKLYDSDDLKTTSVLPNKESKTVNQEPQSKTDFEKSITKFLDGQRVTNMFFKNNVNDMILKIKQNEKNFQIKIKKMERKMDEWSKSQNISSEQTYRTEPQAPPQAHTEQVNAVFTGSGKSDDPSKT